MAHRRRRGSSSEDDAEPEDESEYSELPLEQYSVSEDFHRMNINKKRGWVLLMKNTEFGRRSLPEGNEINTLEDLFKEYNYHVRVKREVTATNMLKHVQHYAKKAGSNCFICFISSHGDLSSIECVEKKRSREDTSVEIEDLFEAANTKQLKGRPKLFFIDACRSDDDPDTFLQNPSIPNDNFLIGMSCLGKTSSMANKSIGDYYLHHIGKIFTESFPLKKVGSQYVRDINYLMQKVNRDVGAYAKSQGDSQKPILLSSLKQQLFLQ